MRIVIGAPGNGVALKDELKAQLEADDRVGVVLDLRHDPESDYGPRLEEIAAFEGR